MCNIELDYCPEAATAHESIDASKIEAEFKNGVLIVHLPKQEAAKPKQVPVRCRRKNRSAEPSDLGDESGLFFAPCVLSPEK